MERRIKNLNQNSNSCKEMSNLLLPQDLMLHIFDLVPIYYLIDSARYVCKHWAATIATFNHHHRVRSTPGIFVKNLMSREDSHYLEFKDHVNPRFETIYLPTPPNMGSVIGTCEGILMLLAPDGYIFLANPILKCWLRLARFPVQYSHRDIIDQCIIACVPHTAKFKLFFQEVVRVSDTLWYVFHVLRVGIDNSWKEMARKEAPFSCYIAWKPIYSGGDDIYWITSEGIIVFNIDKEIIVRWYSYYLWTGNYLSCIAPKCSFEAFEIHILDFDSGKWSLYHEMRPFDYMAAFDHNLIPPRSEFYLWINDLIIFGVDLTNKRIIKYTHFAYNVKTKQLTKIDNIEEGYYELWLHTNTLISLSTTPTA